MKNLKQRIAEQLDRAWYGKSGLTQILRPFTGLFVSVVYLRRLLYRFKLLKSNKVTVPVIVVGNLTVGGTGKTPLVIWIANYLKTAGYNPGIISRGYTGKARNWPQQVRPDADPTIVGDEAVLISRRTGCPMAVGPKRIDDSRALLKYASIDVIISDDGLQHYALQRDIEIAVIDGIRRFGNRFCLPAGPMREPVSRLDEVDFRVTNGIAAQGEYGMRYTGDTAINLVTNEQVALADFRNKDVIAIAGIGHPDKFFNFMRSHGIRLDSRAFPDHYLYKNSDLDFDEDTIVLMTEKDAVKCQRFANNNWWYVPINVELPEEFGKQLVSKLEKHRG